MDFFGSCLSSHDRCGGGDVCSTCAASMCVTRRGSSEVSGSAGAPPWSAATALTKGLASPSCSAALALPLLGFKVQILHEAVWVVPG